MPYDLTDTEILNMLHPDNGGATYYEITEKSPMDIGREQGRYAIDRLKKQGYNITSEKDMDSPKKKRFYVDPDDHNIQKTERNQPTNHSEPKRLSTTSKQTLTKKTRERLIQLEEMIKPIAQEIQPAKWDTQPETSQNGRDLIIHETDPHFGDEVTDEQGNIIYDSPTAEKRVRKRISKIMDKVKQKRNTGQKIDTAHLLLGGDLLTNEAIYSTQPYHIDETVDQQFIRAVKTYKDVLKTLSNNFDHVQVVCTGGNHGEFRSKGSSDKANGDDLVYDTLEIFAQELEMDNMQFIKSDRTDRVIFNFRGHRGFLTHGDQRSIHIGTSSPESDWLSFKDQYDFDAAFRGHYHDFKIEQVNGAPVIMSPSQKPPGEFEDNLGIYGTPHNTVYFASNQNPIAEIERFQVE